ncbi:MAG: hypothetical protein ACM3JG_05375 [Thiohalocapsa sp.]
MATRYPEIVDYNEAVQNPAHSFRDAELRQGRIEVNGLGLPVALSGGFALTYMMRAPRRKLAVRCFLREIPAVQQKYAAIAGACRALKSRYFVDFEYLADAMVLHGAAYPVIKMDWAEGETLGMWVERNHANARALGRLREAFAALATYLEQHKIGHGDIQTGNVIVSREGLRLVDYDGMYVPGMPPEFGCECGHRHFQHPLRTTAHFGPAIDRFSFLVVDLTLMALIEDPALYGRFCRGGEAIILHGEDFADPEASPLLRLIAQRPGLAAAVRNFAAVCRGDISAIPTLSEFRAGRNIPHHAAPRPQAAAAPAGTHARNRNLVARLLGDGAAGRSAPASGSAPVSAPASASPLPSPRWTTLAPHAPAGIDNAAILRGLHSAAPQPPLPPRPAPPSVAQVASPASQRPTPSPPLRPRIPRRGSFVIHPRLRQPRAPAATAPSPPPSAWQRLLRLFKTGS